MNDSTPREIPDGTLMPVSRGGAVTLAVRKDGEWVDIGSQLPFPKDGSCSAIPTGYTDRFGTEP